MPLLETLLAAAAFMVVAWLVSLPKKDASIVDAFWGPAFVLIAAVAYGETEGYDARRWLILGLVALWGLRLGGYLLKRNLEMGEEDHRYRAIRQRTGPLFPVASLVIVFLFQAALSWFISFPLQVGIAADGPKALGWLDALGVLFFAVGFVFEAGGDWQLARFKADPSNEGKVLDTGLWRYTRHPNYFGDFMIWWGFFLIALAVPGGWKTVLSPIVMSVLLMKVSGVTLLEKKLTTSREGYREYVERTNAFFPGPPRSSR